MVKPLSAQLADLSVRAKNAEDAAAVAQKEAHDKLVARRDQAHATVTAAIQKMDQDVKSANEKVVANWNTLKAKVAADMDAWNANCLSSSMFLLSGICRHLDDVPCARRAGLPVDAAHRRAFAFVGVSTGLASGRRCSIAYHGADCLLQLSKALSRSWPRSAIGTCFPISGDGCWQAASPI